MNVDRIRPVPFLPEPVNGPLALHWMGPLKLTPDALQAALLAMGGRAFYGDDDDPDSQGSYQRIGDVAVVSIRGLLLMQGGWCFDGHESIAARCMAALSDARVSKLALLIHSPGGVVAGNFEAVASVRAAAAAAGKPIFAHAKAMAYSAGYAWATAAGEVYLSASAGMGSIGVICAIESVAKMNAENGVDVAVVRSGARKADGHPDLPIDPEAVAAVQKRVDYLADLFAVLVSGARDLMPDAVLAQQAACFSGPEAVTAGLANNVMTEDEFLAMVTARPAGTKGSATMTMKGKFGAAGAENDPVAMVESLGAELAQVREQLAAAESATKKVELERDAFANAFADYVGEKAKREARGTAAEVESLRASFVNDRGVARPRALRDHFEARAPGSALPTETRAPAEAPKLSGPGTTTAPKLDGAKMTLTAIAAHAGDGPLFDRLMAEHSASTREADKALFLRQPAA